MAAPTGPMNEEFGRFVAGTPEPESPAAAAAPVATPDESDQLRTQLAERDATIANLARPTPALAPAAAPIDIPDMPAMPDATTHPVENEAWHRESTTRSERRQDQKVQAIAQSAIGEARALSITQEFVQRHPRFVNMQGQVRTALSGAMSDLGMNVLPDDASSLIESAVKHLDTTAGQFKESQVIADAGHVVVADPDAKSADRSGGMPGGTTAAAPAGKQKTDDDEGEVVSMIDAIKAQQKISGFF